MPPVVIGAGIAAAGAVGAAAIGSHAASKAAKTQQQSTDSSVALQQNIYGQNKAALAPFQTTGVQANNILADALGFGTPTPTQTIPTQQPATPMYAGHSLQGPFAGWGAGPYGTPIVQSATPPQGTVNAPAPNANNAFQDFLHSINYNFQLQQGQNALNGAYAGSGALQSGAALKALSDYNQNTAQGAFQNWFSNVNDLANRGFGAASAQAGVGQNFANSVSNLNSANANALANLQIAKGNNMASLVGGLGTIGANVAGTVLAPPTPNYGLVPGNTSTFAGYF